MADGGLADEARRTAADLTAWTRLLGLRYDEDLRDAEPDTLGQVRYWRAEKADRTC
jgi:hypothetical protein